MTSGTFLDSSPSNQSTTPKTTITQTITTTDYVDYQIVHRIPGRMRIRIPRLLWDTDYSQRLQRLILSNSAITEHRINLAASSLIVSYQAEVTTEAVVWSYLQTAIDLAEKTKEENGATQPKAENTTSQDWQKLGLPTVSLAVAMAAIPLELPFFIVGGLVLAASIPLWQRVSQTVTQDGTLTVDCLDSLWLTAQLIQGNGIAGALSLNLAGVAENLRQSKLAQLEQELCVLFKREDEEIHWLSDQEQFAVVKSIDREQWIKSVEETELMQQVKPIAQAALAPTILLSATVGLLTNDLGRASSLLPLDVGVTIRGVTPLAVVSALTKAARQGVYIRNGRTLEKLAQVDTLLFTQQSFPSLTAQESNSVSDLIHTLNNQNLDWHILADETREKLSTWAIFRGIPLNRVHQTKDNPEIQQLINQLRSQGKTVAWVDDTTGDRFTATSADVVISLALGESESHADVVLHSHDLKSLAYSLSLAKHTMSTAYQSLAIAIVPNLFAVGVGVIFGLDPIIAVLLNGGSAILAELNTLQGYS